METGQTFDRENLERWFKTGANTCPMTAVTLTSMEVHSAFLRALKLARCNHALSAWHAEALLVQMRPNAELLQQMKEWQATGRQRKTMSLPSMPTVPRQAKLPPVGLPPVGAKATAVLASTKSSGLLSARKEEPHTMSLWRLVSCMKPGANAALD